MPKNSLDHIELRSEEVLEILTKVPHWMIRWGNVLFLAIILILLFISWFVKYPDIISSEALITTQIPPQKEYAQITGTFEAILVRDNQEVNKEQLLAVLENTANYKDVYQLKSVLDTITVNSKLFNLPIETLPIFNLGDIESHYALFLTNYRHYRAKGEIALFKDVVQSFYQLKKAIKDWEYLYVLKSNINGKVSYLDRRNANQSVNQGDLVFTIIPSKNSSIIAKLKIPVQNSGKLKTDQKVKIKIDNYPDTEYGVLNGKVKNISLLPGGEGMYIVNVELPKKLITSANKKIDFKHEMRGTAEIITKDLRLIERFFYQFKDFASR